jgi:hypothetical protein
MIRVELSLRLPNSPGALATVCQALSDAAINMLAMSLEAGGHLRVVVDNAVHAAGRLRELHYQVSERDVLVLGVPNGPGALGAILRLVADSGVNVEYAYGGGPEATPSAVVVVGVSDAMRAAAAAGV